MVFKNVISETKLQTKILRNNSFGKSLLQINIISGRSQIMCVEIKKYKYMYNFLIAFL